MIDWPVQNRCVATHLNFYMRAEADENTLVPGSGVHAGGRLGSWLGRQSILCENRQCRSASAPATLGMESPHPSSSAYPR